MTPDQTELGVIIALQFAINTALCIVVVATGGALLFAKVVAGLLIGVLMVGLVAMVGRLVMDAWWQ